MVVDGLERLNGSSDGDEPLETFEWRKERARRAVCERCYLWSRAWSWSWPWWQRLVYHRAIFGCSRRNYPTFPTIEFDADPEPRRCQMSFLRTMPPELLYEFEQYFCGDVLRAIFDNTNSCR
jgi:hypothetical protein